MVGLYILHIAAQHCENPSTARIIVTSNSKKAHKEAFTQSPVGITTATQPNHDMILEIRRLRNAIPVPVQAYHTPHQNSGVPRRHPILSIPTHVHTTFQTQSNQQSLSTLWSYTPEAHIISLTSNGTEIVGDVLPTVCRAMYVNDLKQKLLKDNLWTDKTFDTINWEAYHGVLRTLPRTHRISIAKLSHQLWQTNVRNHRFYQQSNKCPICLTVSETWTHILSCDHLVAQEQRRAALSTLVTALKDKNTPPQVVESMVSGLSQWFSHPAD